MYVFCRTFSEKLFYLCATNLVVKKAIHRRFFDTVSNSLLLKEVGSD